jgi:hypothetical protein
MTAAMRAAEPRLDDDERAAPAGHPRASPPPVVSTPRLTTEPDQRLAQAMTRRRPRDLRLLVKL